MARRKKHAKKHHKRRKSHMSGVPKNALTTILGITAGAVAGRYVAKKLLPNVKEEIKNAGVLVLGAMVMPKVMKSDLGRAIGNGMIAAGGVGLAGSFLPAIAGTEDMIEFPVTVGEIDDNLSVIAGDDYGVMAGDNLEVIAGDDEDMY
jgi:hypothetical protein